ncbi:cation efflux family-domain-containing protein [Dipodascopsis tothii]|uniref:cation efflux family-domain-containing protein n=1 Tax=Dipodascopsis tothii TaxID=44089 RepID=UPI0034CDC78E
MSTPTYGDDGMTGGYGSDEYTKSFSSEGSEDASKLAQLAQMVAPATEATDVPMTAYLGEDEDEPLLPRLEYVRSNASVATVMLGLDSRGHRRLLSVKSVDRLAQLHSMRAQYLVGDTRAIVDWEALRVDETAMRQAPHRVRKFYADQNELIDRYIEIDCLLDSNIAQSMVAEYEGSGGRSDAVPANVDVEGAAFLAAERDEGSGIVAFAIAVNFLINVLLLAGKAAVVLLTHSLSVVASLVDSALDFLCTTIIWFSTSMVEASSWKIRLQYPIGRARLEPIGVLIFSVIIILSFGQVAVEALSRLLVGSHEAVRLTAPSFVIMAAAVVLKLFAWLWCRSMNSSAVQALAQDAMSDIVFNIFSICFPVLGHYSGVWWLDPLGALLLSVYIIIQWAISTSEHIRHLVGVTASDVDRQVVVYLCMRFARAIHHVTNVRAYHLGDRLHVEVDVIVSEKLTVRDSHDLGEALQYALETLPMVERAFVHLDYRRDNYAGHLQR